MNGDRIGRSPRPRAGQTPPRDPWSKAEIIAVVIGTVASVIVVPLVIWLVTTLTELQVRVGVIDERLKSINTTLMSMDDRLGKLESWQINHLDGHPIGQLEDYDTATGE